MQINSKKTRFIIFNLLKPQRSESFINELRGEKLYRVSGRTKEMFVCLVGVLLGEDLFSVHHIAYIKVKLS